MWSVADILEQERRRLNPVPQRGLRVMCEGWDVTGVIPEDTTPGEEKYEDWLARFRTFIARCEADGMERAHVQALIPSRVEW